MATMPNAIYAPMEDMVGRLIGLINVYHVRESLFDETEQRKTNSLGRSDSCKVDDWRSAFSFSLGKCRLGSILLEYPLKRNLFKVSSSYLMSSWSIANRYRVTWQFRSRVYNVSKSLVEGPKHSRTRKG